MTRAEVLITSEQITEKVREIGESITRDYAGERLLLVGVLRGAVVVMGDLMRCINLPCEIDFMDISSYGSGTSSSGVVRILKDLEEDITGKHVLIVEGIIATGLTLSYLMRSLMTRKPASLEIFRPSASDPARVERDVKYRASTCATSSSSDTARLAGPTAPPRHCVLKKEVFD